MTHCQISCTNPTATQWCQLLLCQDIAYHWAMVIDGRWVNLTQDRVYVFYVATHSYLFCSWAQVKSQLHTARSYKHSRSYTSTRGMSLVIKITTLQDREEDREEERVREVRGRGGGRRKGGEGEERGGGEREEGAHTYTQGERYTKKR